ncbi:glycosyltransferase family 4 protein [Larkinella terrae]|uniref:Glycosyltransferase n=1 Tax=Larkinella terrae TaxID=2025311 RepID=A0A7K0EGU7_9BACT|nr:glycosyltransferase family 4 protein [Larkinella terrae]MRS60942.1 glycosyltransferase [Larkinella terrae]
MSQFQTVIQAFSVPASLGFIDKQIPYFRKRGVEMQIICSSGADLTAFAEKYGVAYEVVPFIRSITPLNDLYCLWRSYRLFKKKKPVIVHGNTPKAGLLSMLAAFLAGVPIRIYEIHGFPFESRRGFSRWLLMTMERIACQAATQILLVSSSLRNQAVKLNITDAAKLTVPHHGSCNGVDAIDRYNPARLDGQKVARLKETLNLNGPVIGFVGRLTRDKGILELAKAWKMIRDDFPELLLLIVGPSELVTAAEKEIIDELLQHPRVRWIGFVADIEYYYALLDFILLPTYREGLGNVLLEAGAMEVPAIASRVTGTVDALIEGKTGLFCEPYSAESLAGQIRNYLNNPELVREHGRNSRERVLRDFAPIDVWNAKYKIYKQAFQSVGIALDDSAKHSVEA